MRNPTSLYTKKKLEQDLKLVLNLPLQEFQQKFKVKINIVEIEVLLPYKNYEVLQNIKIIIE